eukprot:3384841-Pleurochrysis_carterae.AAC.2
MSVVLHFHSLPSRLRSPRCNASTHARYGAAPSVGAPPCVFVSRRDTRALVSWLPYAFQLVAPRCNLVLFTAIQCAAG